jgi:CheY-like chemotaxis protein
MTTAPMLRETHTEGESTLHNVAFSQVHVARRTRVLLAEDDPAMRSLLAWMLRRDGYDVTEAQDGVEAVAYVLASWGFGAAGRRQFNLIISDIRMPGWTGLEILAIMQVASQPTRVILITAFGSAETHEQARRLGAAAVFDKPFDFEDLRAAVSNLMLP